MRSSCNYGRDQPLRPRPARLRVAAAAPAMTYDALYRFVNVAQSASAAQSRAPHLTEELRHLVSREAWREFPSTRFCTK